MKFLKSVFKVNAGASFMEKAVTYFVPVFVAFLLLWLIVASYGVGHSALANSHKAGRGWGEAIPATIIYAAAAFWAWWNWTDRIPFRVNDVVATIILLLLLALGVNANTGFFAATY